MDDATYAFRVVQLIPAQLERISQEATRYIVDGTDQSKTRAIEYAFQMQTVFSTISPFDMIENSFLREIGEYLPALNYVVNTMEPRQENLGALLTLIRDTRTQCDSYLRLAILDPISAAKVHSLTDLLNTKPVGKH